MGALAPSAPSVEPPYFLSVAALDNAFIHNFLLGNCASGECCWQRSRGATSR